MTIRIMPSKPEDRPRIRQILLDSDLFKASDADCVDEMFALSVDKPTPDNYRFLSAWLDDWMVGFACFGWEALTCGTWDLFWVCTLPSARGKGIGNALVAEALRVASSEKGRLMVVNTSSTPAYLPARKLYEANQFVRTATVPEYYNLDDDLYIYTKKLLPPII
jgi:ribosomal protein S18 acetylase RimI-like enzyme